MEFYNYGNSITKHTSNSKYVGLRRFKTFFGVSPGICVIVWEHLKDVLPADYKEYHLLWALLFLKCYHKESVNSALVGCDEKTFRKRVWVVVEQLAFMKVIEWENRKLGSVGSQTTFTSLDGVDFSIHEPKLFSPKRFSHKLKGAGLRYEIGLSLRLGEIVWAYGGFPCGAYPDLKIARECFIDFLEPNERSVADKGYQDPTHFLLPNNRNSVRHKFIMSRHETINKRIKQFNVLAETFRHDISQHKQCFHAVLNITSIIIKNEEPLFSIF